MDYPWAYPGAKIVCVDDGFDLSIAPDIRTPPRKGCRYTIRQAHIGRDDIVFLELAEMPGDHWDVEGFRPLISRTQSDDIAMFQRIADKAASQKSIHVSEDA